MPRQKRVEPPKYKTADDVIACETEGAGKHRVRPNMWPPPASGLERENPSLSLRCELCGTNCIVYTWHGEENEWIEVVKPNRVKQPA